MRRNDEVYDS